MLVGVVAISMFSFVAPPAEAAEAAEANSNGTLSMRNKGWYTAEFNAVFYNSSWERLGIYHSGYLEGLGTRNPRDIKIPKGTCRVHVHIDILGGWWRPIKFYADESTVNENSRIELTSTGTFLFPEFDVKINNGWIVE